MSIAATNALLNSLTAPQQPQAPPSIFELSILFQLKQSLWPAFEHTIKVIEDITHASMHALIGRNNKQLTLWTQGDMPAKSRNSGPTLPETHRGILFLGQSITLCSTHYHPSIADIINTTDVPASKKLPFNSRSDFVPRLIVQNSFRSCSYFCFVFVFVFVFFFQSRSVSSFCFSFVFLCFLLFSFVFFYFLLFSLPQEPQG